MTSERLWNWVDRLALDVLRRAAQRAALPLSQRLEEEWQGDMQQQAHPLGRLRFAFGCRWAIGVIVCETPAAPRFLPTYPVARTRAVPHAIDDTAFMTGRATSFVLIAALQAGLLCCVCTASKVTTPAEMIHGNGIQQSR